VYTCLMYYFQVSFVQGLLYKSSKGLRLDLSTGNCHDHLCSSFGNSTSFRLRPDLQQPADKPTVNMLLSFKKIKHLIQSYLIRSLICMLSFSIPTILYKILQSIIVNYVILYPALVIAWFHEHSRGSELHINTTFA